MYVVFGLLNTCGTSEQPKDCSELCILGLGMQKIISLPPSPTCHELSQGSWASVLQPESPHALPSWHGQVPPAAVGRGKQRGQSGTHALLWSCQAAGEAFGADLFPGHAQSRLVLGFPSPTGPWCSAGRLWVSQGRYHQWCKVAASTSQRAWECPGCAAVHGCCLPAACTAARDYAAACSRQGPHAMSHMVIT